MHLAFSMVLRRVLPGFQRTSNVWIQVYPRSQGISESAHGRFLRLLSQRMVILLVGPEVQQSNHTPIQQSLFALTFG